LVPAPPANDPVRQPDAETPSDLLADMDRAGVTTSLVVLQEEPGEFLRLAGDHPGRLFGLAFYDSLAPHRGLAQVQGLCDGHPGLILGVVAAFACFHQDPRLRDFAPLYEYCVQRDLPIQLCMGSDAAGTETGRPVAAAVLARSYPRLKIVCRFPRGRDGEMPGLLERFSNLFVQVEALEEAGPGVEEGFWPFQLLLGAAGSRRLMFGSGWHGRAATYFRRVEALCRLPWWQRRNVGWRTAVLVYGPRILGS
jgi:predicted TIM-barrel fold metal-dependent hydrolase